MRDKYQDKLLHVYIKKTKIERKKKMSIKKFSRIKIPVQKKSWTFVVFRVPKYIYSYILNIKSLRIPIISRLKREMKMYNKVITFRQFFQRVPSRESVNCYLSFM